jgi:Ca-activated chloride channel family protein
MKKTSKGKARIVFMLIVVVLIIGIGAAYMIVTGRIYLGGSLSYEQAVSRLSSLLKRVSWSENIVQRKAQIQLSAAQDITEMLPEITKFPLMNQPQITSNDVAVEIFASTEKSGTGTDGWMVEVAEAFNAQNLQLSTGRHAKVLIRKIASGTGYEFIASRKYLPDGFSPSSHLWIQMAAAHGVKMTPIQEKTVGNIAGIVMKTSVAQQLKSSYGTLDIKNLIDAVVQGKLAMGYTNPFASSTGLNFLFTVLATFAGGKENLMLDPAVVSAFESFQRGVPFVSETTLQMRDSVEKGGSLDAFVMEYQTFSQTKVLQSGYEFIPFGVRHDNPLYAVGDPSAEKMEVLEKFGTFAEQPQFQKVASNYGFNPPIQYTSPFPIPSGDVLIQAQQLWKQKKDAGKSIVAVFLCDVSGSMDGTRIRALKKSLLGGSEFIAPENAIGLVVFNNQVTVVLPVKKFDLSQKAAFYAAVEDMSAGGQTAMYSGITVALSMLVEAKQQTPNTKATLFVLTDGETNSGLSFNDIRPVILGLKIPIYTIGYEANLPVLQELSSLVEAASINADAEEVQYTIGSLLNAQM